MKILFLFCMFLSFVACEGVIAQAYEELDSEVERIEAQHESDKKIDELEYKLSSMMQIMSSSSRAYISSSSVSYISSSSTLSYTTGVKTLALTLTEFYQESSFEGTSSTTDADPIIYFTINFLGNYGETISTTKTSNYISSSSDTRNLYTWSGYTTNYYSVPIGTKSIQICPAVIDYDPFTNDDYSSGYCKTKSNIGQLKSSEIVNQSDFSGYYSLYWEFQVIE